MKTLTIITPTYNRADLLGNLYHSLEKQTNMDFCWMIVDDGSVDHTYDVVKNLTSGALFEIKYLRKDNGGKHTALNFGIKEIKSPLTIIVDSDDRLTTDAVQSILEVHSRYINNADISTYSFLKGYENGKPIVQIGNKEFIGNYIQDRIKNRHSGDMAEVFRTEYLKQYPFPEFPKEKFVSEDVVWIEIGKHSESVFINKIIYICEYLDGGLTANDKKLKFASPLGSMFRGKQLMSKECGIKENIRGALIFDCYKRDCKEDYSGYFTIDLREKILTSILFMVSIYYYKKWKKSIGDQ